MPALSLNGVKKNNVLEVSGIVKSLSPRTSMAF